MYLFDSHKAPTRSRTGVLSNYNEGLEKVLEFVRKWYYNRSSSIIIEDKWIPLLALFSESLRYLVCTGDQGPSWRLVTVTGMYSAFMSRFGTVPIMTCTRVKSFLITHPRIKDVHVGMSIDR